MEKGLYCPWASDMCPGEDKCAPAVFYAERMKASPAVLEAGATVLPRCPIVRGLETLHVLNAAGFVLVEREEAQMRKAEQPPTRSDVLRRLGIVPSEGSTHGD